MQILSEFIDGDYKILTIRIPKDKQIKIVNKDRTNKQNKYFWELLGNLCQEMNLDVIKEYRRRVKNVGVFRQWEIESKNVPTFETMWESKGIGWFIEIVDTFYKDNKEHKLINAYYGSSSYNVDQFRRLLDALIQDCNSIGIETLTPQELEEMYEVYNQQR